MDGDAPEDKEGDMVPLGVGLRDRGGAAESELILVGVMESDRDPVGVPVVLSDALLEMLPVPVAVTGLEEAVGVRVAGDKEEVAVADVLSEADDEMDAVPLDEEEYVAAGLSVTVEDTVSTADAVAMLVCVEVEVLDMVAEGVAVGEGDTVATEDADDMLVFVLEPVPDGVEVTEDDRLDEEVLLPELVPVWVAVDEVDPREVRVKLDDSDTEPDTLAVDVCEDVGRDVLEMPEVEPLGDEVETGVTEDVAVKVTVITGELVDTEVCVPVGDAIALTDIVVADVYEADEESVIEEVLVIVNVNEDELLPVGEGESEREREEERVPLTDSETLADALAVAVKVCSEDAVPEAVELEDGIDDKVEKALTDDVDDCVITEDGDCVETGLPDTDEETVNAGLPDTDELSVDTGLPDTDELTVDVTVPLTLTERGGERVTDGLSDALEETLDEIEGENEAVALTVEVDD